VLFSPLSSLGAGSDERTQTPLGAHQKRILIAIKDNMAFDRTDLRFLYYTENSHEYMASKSFNHHFIFITPIQILPITK
jgi:hypothetical protein